MISISNMTAAQARALRFVLMDIDDTLTTEGKLPAESYAALWKLHEAGLVIVPITGRPAGWCDLIAREWPVDGVVGENGAFVFWEEPKGRHLKSLTNPSAVRNDAPELTRVLERALVEIPGCRPACDQFARLYDIAIDFAEEEPRLPLSDALRIKKICDDEGVRAKVSSIHVNAWMGNYDKLSMAITWLAARFGYSDERDRNSVIFVGDSPNDEPMFAHFPMACGVANVRRYESMIMHMPAFAASREGGLGFAEIAETILSLRGCEHGNGAHDTQRERT
ncbi:MAG: HAD-IIB family hydrolase [Spirochaetes bacterium]|nr:HAD-IIB family hydrolase [Spirochaetota bacterium]